MKKVISKAQVIEALNLIPLPGEGGFYLQSYLSKESTVAKTLGGRSVTRPKYTAILYLVGGNDFSAFHKVPFEEFYHFVAGAPCVLTQIGRDGILRNTKLGSPLEVPDAQFQAVVEAGALQGSRSLGEWTLLGTYMSPGFDFADCEIPSREQLIRQFPQYSQEIVSLTK